MPSALVEWLPPTSGLQILDLGCGGGRIAACFDDAIVHGLDNSKHLLQEARQKNPQINFICGDFQSPEVWQQIPPLDLIISNCAIRKDYCPNLADVMRLCHSKLSPNGTLLLRIESVFDMSEVLPKHLRESLFYSNEELIECLKMFKIDIKEEAFRQKFSSVEYMKKFLERIQLDSINIKCLNPTRRYLIVHAEKSN
jgi:trans-aconitate methyltransferase